MTEVSQRAAFLSDRSDFTLLHCGQQMVPRRSLSTWQGQRPDGTSTLENQYRCDRCGTTLDLKLVEPDQADETTDTRSTVGDE